MRTLDKAHTHFVSSIRWVPPLIKEANVNGEAGPNGTTESNGAKEDPASKMSIRCVIATGSVDKTVRVFAS